MYFTRILLISLGIVGLINSSKAESKTKCATDNIVCGSDGKTYANSCALEQAGTKLAHEGECDKQGTNKTAYRPEQILKSKLANNTDEGVKKKLVKHFNPDTGKWEYSMEILPTIVITPNIQNIITSKIMESIAQNKGDNEKDETAGSVDITKTKTGDAGLAGESQSTKNHTSQLVSHLGHHGLKPSLSKRPSQPLKLTSPLLQPKNKTRPFGNVTTGSVNITNTKRGGAGLAGDSKSTKNVTKIGSPVTKNHTSQIISHFIYHGLKPSLSKRPSQPLKLTSPLLQPKNKTRPFGNVTTGSVNITNTKKGDAGLVGDSKSTKNVTKIGSPISKNHTSQLISHFLHHGLKPSLSKRPSQPLKLMPPLVQPRDKTRPFENETIGRVNITNTTKGDAGLAGDSQLTKNVTEIGSPVSTNRTSQLTSHLGHHGLNLSSSKKLSQPPKLTPPLVQPKDQTRPLEVGPNSPVVPFFQPDVTSLLTFAKPDRELYPGWYYMRMFFSVDHDNNHYNHRLLVNE